MRYAAIASEGEHHSGIAGLRRLLDDGPWNSVVDFMEILTKLNKPQCQTHIKIRTISTNPPFFPQASVMILKTGRGSLRTASKSWMDERKLVRTKNPKRPEAAMLDSRPSGASRTAFLVSSQRWAYARSPCKYYSTIHARNDDCI